MIKKAGGGLSRGGVGAETTGLEAIWRSFFTTVWPDTRLPLPHHGWEYQIVDTKIQERPCGGGVYSGLYGTGAA